MVVDAEQLEAVWTLVVPLVEADGGEVYLVRQSATEVHVHLAGSCSGCPGTTLVEQHLFAPAFKRHAPKVTLKMTAGWRIPVGSARLQVANGSVVTGEEVTIAGPRVVSS